MQLQGEPQAGMIQKFLEHEQTADEDEWGRQEINKLRVREVHMVGALDVRLFNCDRHGGNLLLDQSKDRTSRLVPIDHEFTLPKWTDLSQATFCWLSWPQVSDLWPVRELCSPHPWEPQAKESFDSETLTYIEELDPWRDMSLLR